MKVSVVLPNYNGARFLQESIQSVLKQTFVDFELIIVDDGSTDSSKEIIESFVDNRIRTIYLADHCGICRALNIGLNETQGEYIARMDSDDIWLPRKLEKQVEYLDMLQNIDLCFTFARLIDEDGYNGSIRYPKIDALYHTSIESQKELFERLLFKGNCLNHPSVMIRKASFEEVGMYYRLTNGKCQDLELWTRFLAYGKHIGMLEEELVEYRWLPHLGWNDRFPSKKNVQQFYNEHISIIKRVFMIIKENVFRAWYQEEFIRPEAQGEYELYIEKAFFLMKQISEYELMPVVTSLFEGVLDSLEGQRILFDLYHFKIQDYYRLLQNEIYFDSIAIQEIHNLNQTIDALKEELEEDEEDADESISRWHLLNPFK